MACPELAVLSLLGCWQLHAQSALQAQLEVNLGPIAIDVYDGTSQNSSSLIASGPNNGNCSYGPGSNYRACMQSVLNAYAQQGVVGVRVQFGMNGDGIGDPGADSGSLSTPFLNPSGSLDPNWLARFSLFLQDVRAANIQYVTFTPAWSPFGTGRMSIYACISGPPYRYDFTCTANNPNTNAVFYPWLPWALTYRAGSGQGGPFDEAGQLAWQNAPELGDINTQAGAPQPWRWTSDSTQNSPLFKFLDAVFTAVAQAQLQVREFDIYPEIPMRASSIYGRMTFDPVQLVGPMDVINTIMQAHGISPAAAMSTAAFQPQNDQYCVSPYNNFPNSGLVLDEFLLLSAGAQGAFGRVAPNPQTNYYCGTIDPSDSVVAPYSTGIALVDVHAYPADYIWDSGFGWISVPNFTGFQYYPDGAPITNSPNGCAFTGCAQNNSYDYDLNNISGSSVTAANMIYQAVSNFMGFWSLNNLWVVVGETDAYNPGGIGRDGINFPSTTEGSDCTTYGPYGSILFDPYTDPKTGVTHNVNFTCTPNWKWHRPWSTVSAGENVAGFVASGLNRPTAVLRPWAPVSWGTIITPAPLSGNSSLPYNVGACQFTIGGYTLNDSVPAAGGPVTVTVTNVLKSGCQWSIGPVAPPQPSLQALAWPSDSSGNLIVTGASINSGLNCVYPAQQVSSNCWGSGAGPVSVTFQIASNPTQAQRTFSVNVAGLALTFTQATAGQAPAAPAGLTPGSGAAGVALTPTLTWTATSNTSYYLVYFQNQNPVQVNGTSYSPGTLLANMTYTWYVGAVNAAGQTNSQPASFTTAAAAALDFYPVTPCRVADTRVAAGFTGAFGAPALSSGQTRTFVIPASPCGIPATAVAYSLNITVVPHGYLGVLTTWPAGQSMPNVSTLNSYDGRIAANAAIVPAGTGGAINVNVSDTTDLIIDVNGYFAAQLSSGLTFFAVTPCRIADTRTAAGFSGAFGPPAMTAGSQRSFAIPSSACSVPAAAAYSLNFTVVPPGPLGNLTTWPTGQAMPNVSTLNDSNATIVANAAIVPGGANGAISVFVTDTTDVLFDINGYFASGSGLHFYPVTPCRVADTRVAAGFSGVFGPPAMPGGSQRSFPLPASSCGIPSSAVAYSLNFTVVPGGVSLGNLTTWPTGQPMPNVSTLNDSAGTVLSNAAIVSAGTGGAISVYVTNTTDVLFDINGYFAP